MHFSFAALALLAGSALVQAQKTCGTKDASPNLVAEAQKFGRINAFRAQALKNTPKEDQDPKGTRTLKVKTYVHNIYVNRTVAGGWIPNADMEKQVRHMNEHFESTGITFDLRRVIHTKNPKWATYSIYDNPEVELEMKKSIRRGDYADLNIYLRPLGDGLLGFCYFPDDVAPDSDEFWYDGCEVLHTTIPDGSEFPYDEGKTATHEVGHWLGLFHTFQGGCDGGDEVADTPAQRSPTNGCPVGKDTCTGPKYPGADPIHNYMDYSYE